MLPAFNFYPGKNLGALEMAEQSITNDDGFSQSH